MKFTVLEGVSWKQDIHLCGPVAFLNIFLTFPTGSPIATFEYAQIFQNTSPLTLANKNVWRLHLLQPYNKLPYFSLLHITNEISFLHTIYMFQLTLILRRSRTGTVWFYTSTSNKRAARPKLYRKSLTRDLKLMYSRLTLVRISINL